MLHSNITKKGVSAQNLCLLLLFNKFHPFIPKYAPTFFIEEKSTLHVGFFLARAGRAPSKKRHFDLVFSLSDLIFSKIILTSILHLGSTKISGQKRQNERKSSKRNPGTPVAFLLPLSIDEIETHIFLHPYKMIIYIS